MAPQQGDKRREDLVVPYVHMTKESRDATAMFSNTLPLAAMFMRNKLLAWVGVFTAIQTYLNEPKNKKPTESSQPAWVTCVTAIVGLLTCYMDFVVPPKTFQKAAEAAATATASASS